ncbi:MAG: hypothetical protein EXS10_08070 [Phycisphaerales bacterium]|nr:hypothetical protein [Phycisphaerales bacterium]
MSRLPSIFLPLKLAARFASSFHPSALPQQLQRNYARELLSWAFLPTMLAVIEGGTLSIIVGKAFAGQPGVTEGSLNLAIAWVTAAPNLANTTSFVWAALSRGRDKVKFISALQIATAILIALVALLPRDGNGLLGICILAGLARATWTGVITVRTAVWRNNYPKADRATIAGKMATVQALVLAAAGLLVGQVMDLSPRNYQLLFPLLALVGLLGNQIYATVRLRGGKKLMHAERTGRAGGVGLNPAGMVHLLRDDKLYAEFMGWMMVYGFGNLMLGPPIAYVLTQELHTTYLEGILVSSVIPLAVMPLAIPLWARMLDRCHVIEFRAVHGWTFIVASALCTAATVMHSIWLFYLAGVAMGIGYAGGTLAWNLGHHDFAPADRDSDYMAVHVTLNGVRGLIAPIVAWGLYAWLAPLGFSGIVMLICTLVNVAGMIGFIHMRRKLRKSALAIL